MFHKDCGDRVLVDLSVAWKLFATGIPSENGVNITSIRVNSESSSGGKSKYTAKYYCPHCRKNVSPEEIVLRCSRCENSFPINKIFTGEKSGGCFCEKCGHVYLKEERLVSLEISYFLI